MTEVSLPTYILVVFLWGQSNPSQPLEFRSLAACQAAAEWTQKGYPRGAVSTLCLDKATLRRTN